ncbi:hypothetical protein D9V37_08310 [Nocardioides mangrovicus]|uniref:Uncharacterized protein n=2 Tax=Nocardioides mangrovicus TaxID=2478913 RepID=A0A3L8P3D7_9ACTN|nr:hypothetical protein D9V37_08310 [Nocardioides mangrovicus]
MALAHVAAAVVVGLWLAGGERALWTIVALLVEGIRQLAAPLVPTVPARRPAPFVVRLRRPHAWPLLRGVVLVRGP